MAKIYYNRIKADIMKIGDVPPLWRAATQALLDADATTEEPEPETE